MHSTFDEVPMNKLLAFSLFTVAVSALLPMVDVRGDDVHKPEVQRLERALFAAGCFWKVQYLFSKLPGVVRTRAGYSGGFTTSPTYKQVCTDKTGHAETVLVEFDPSKTTYRKLLEVFWANHDPTTLNRQGPDIGAQYRSVIFYTTPEQHRVALEYKRELEKSRRFQAPIITAIEPAGQFYEAEEYHQDYVVKHGSVCY